MSYRRRISVIAVVIARHSSIRAFLDVKVVVVTAHVKRERVGVHVKVKVNITSSAISRSVAIVSLVSSNVNSRRGSIVCCGSDSEGRTIVIAIIYIKILVSASGSEVSESVAAAIDWSRGGIAVVRGTVTDGCVRVSVKAKVISVSGWSDFYGYSAATVNVETITG